MVLTQLIWCQKCLTGTQFTNQGVGSADLMSKCLTETQFTNHGVDSADLSDLAAKDEAESHLRQTKYNDTKKQTNKKVN